MPRDSIDAVYRSLFESQSGKAVLKHLLKRGDVLNTAFDVNPHAHAYNEGRRAMVLEIFKRAGIIEPLSFLTEVSRDSNHNQIENNQLIE